MWICKNCGQSIDDDYFKCWKCGTEEDGTKDPSFTEVVEEPGGGELITSEELILSNTSLAGVYEDIRVIGVVCSEIIIGTDIISKLFSNVVNLVGGSSESYQSYVEKARHQVTDDIIDHAIKAGANGIMGIKYNYENIGDGMLLVGATGTAVIVGPKKS